MQPQTSVESTIPREPLTYLCESDRFISLDTAEAYFRGRQDDGKSYDWNGHLRGFGNEASIDAGFVVPHSMRRPDARYDLGRLIVRRLTSLVFGQDHFPELRMEGDEAAEDYVRTLASESRLSTRMAEARDLGGAAGTACLSWGFVNGKPRVQVHNPKHVTPLRWADEDELRPAEVLKAFAYPRSYYARDSKRIVTETFWRVRWWDETREITWRAIPQSVAETDRWQEWERTEILHNYGFCPFYWIQNRPCSSDYDGEGDFSGQESTIDRINHLMSATTKGTIANVDPTLVVHMDPAMNLGNLRKGSEQALFSPGGAEYLELKGTAVAAAERQMDRLVNAVLDVCGVIMADPDKLSGAAQSARALEILYAPMLANCDILREQYGEHGIKPIVLDMLRVARRMSTAMPSVDADGRTVRAVVVLPPRMVRMEAEGDEEGEEVPVEREPGTSEQISLNWRPYFSPTWADISTAVTAAKNANGGAAVISQRTGAQAVAPLFGVKDVDAEMKQIRSEQDESEERAARAFGPAAPTSGPMFEDPEEDDELDVPDENAVASAPVADVQKSALNGAQVQSLVAIAKDVAMGQLPVDTAAEIIAVSFQLSLDDARRVLGSAGSGFKPSTPEAAPSSEG